MSRDGPEWDSIQFYLDRLNSTLERIADALEGNPGWEGMGVTAPLDTEGDDN